LISPATTVLNVDSTAKRERRKEARPGELLAAALDLFVEKGFAATRSEEVAQRAGVSKGTLFLYFPTKEDLFKAVVRANIGKTITEGAAELGLFKGSTADMIPYMLQLWWDRFGNTKASGLSKLMMSEATNFPELAAFYYQEVIEPNHRLIKAIVQRGIDQGEFRPVDVDNAVFNIITPMVYLINWKHSMGCCISHEQQINPDKYLAAHADMVVHALLKHN
jgi:TetR/AcrR family transcriptional regulator